MMDQEPNLNDIIKRLEAVEHKLGIYHIPNAALVLEELIINLDSRTIQQIFREVEANDLALGIIGFKIETLRKL
jgi:hypothetical protein